MRRDFELIRQILLRVEDTDKATNVLDLGLDEHPFPALARHVELLEEAGLVKAQIAWNDASGSPIYVQVERLTWAGHEFLDDARSHEVWQHATDTISARGGSASFALLRELVTQAARHRLGLPTERASVT